MMLAEMIVQLEVFLHIRTHRWFRPFNLRQKIALNCLLGRECLVHYLNTDLGRGFLFHAAQFDRWGCRIGDWCASQVIAAALHLDPAYEFLVSDLFFLKLRFQL